MDAMKSKYEEKSTTNKNKMTKDNLENKKYLKYRWYSTPKKKRFFEFLGGWNDNDRKKNSKKI